jgi:hypothetical protein
MDHNNKLELQESGWIKNVKFLKRKNQENTEINIDKINEKAKVLDDVSCMKPSKAKIKSRKLVFKKPKGITKNNIQNIHDVSDRFNETELKTAIRQDTKKINPSSFSKRPAILHEYGPDVNGYTFIAFSKQEIPEAEEADEVGAKSNASSDASLNQDNMEYDYKKYILAWNDIESGIPYEHLPLPISTDNLEDINEKNVTEFMGTKKNLKIERIRWHPDKMKSLLLTNNMWYSDIDQHITAVFQAINQAYENK